MKNIECIGGPLDGEICPVQDWWGNPDEVYQLRGGDWPDTTKTGARRRLEYVYKNERLMFKKYL